MGLGPNPKKSARIAESIFGYLKVCKLIVQCQKNPKKQAIALWSRMKPFRSENKNIQFCPNCQNSDSFHVCILQSIQINQEKNHMSQEKATVSH